LTVREHSSFQSPPPGWRRARQASKATLARSAVAPFLRPAHLFAGAAAGAASGGPPRSSACLRHEQEGSHPGGEGTLSWCNACSGFGYSLASPHSNCTSCAVLKLASTSSLWLYNQSSRAHKRLCGCRLALPLALLLLLLLLSLLACTPRLTLSPTRGRDRRKWRGPMTAAAHAKLATWWGASAELPGRPLIAKRS